jgi:hypothetical protein
MSVAAAPRVLGAVQQKGRPSRDGPIIRNRYLNLLDGGSGWRLTPVVSLNIAKRHGRYLAGMFEVTGVGEDVEQRIP